MNIFFVDRDPKIAAQCLNDSHIRKMLIESCQLLCSAHWTIDPNDDIPFRLTHKNHPCAIWTRTSLLHYQWLCQHALAIAGEFLHRFGKVHATTSDARWCALNIPELSVIQWSDPPLCFGDFVASSKDAVEAYREYYDSKRLMKNGRRMDIWTNREPPDWWTP